MNPPPPQRSLLWKSLACLCRIFTTLCFDFKTFGEERVPRSGGVLLVTNHQSFLDPILLGVRLLRPVSFFARHSLFENRYFGWLIRSVNAFPVHRGKPDIAAFRETIRRLRGGHVLNIFPEGTRAPDRDIGRLQKGIALIVRQAGVPVIPVVVTGSFEAWPRTRKLFRHHPIYMQFGHPLSVEGLENEQIVELIERTLKRMLQELRDQIRANSV